MLALPGVLRRQRPIPAPKRGPASRLAGHMPGAGQGLRFSEWLLLGVFALAYLLSISQPLFGIQLHRTILNHFPLVLLAPVMALQLSSVALNPRPAGGADVFRACWPLVLLAAYVLVGSMLARMALKVQDSYLALGLYLTLLPLWAMAAPTDPARLAAWCRALAAIWFFFSFAALCGELARVQTRATLHEIEYLVICGFFVVHCMARSTGVKVLMLLLLLLAAGINQKLTGYIIATMAVMHLVIVSRWHRAPQRWKSAWALGAVALSVLVVVTLVLLYFSFREYLPSGNAEVRLKQYEAAWRQFLDSPLWGQAFLKGSGEDYVESSRVMSLPTHSDVLDLLKHGGALALALFAWGYWKIFALFNRAIAATRDDRRLNGYFVGARFFQVTALVTFSVNPLLLKGPFLIVIWGNLGLAVGLALTATRRLQAARRT